VTSRYRQSPYRKRLRLWWGDVLCMRLGVHKFGIHYEDGRGSHGDDCVRCGAGPLR